MSLPATSASASTSPESKYLVTPFISKASVKMSPSKPISPRKIFVTVFFDRAVGRLGRSSKAGTWRWAIIMLPTPFLAKARKGYSSILSKRAFE